MLILSPIKKERSGGRGSEREEREDRLLVDGCKQKET